MPILAYSGSFRLVVALKRHSNVLVQYVDLGKLPTIPTRFGTNQGWAADFSSLQLHRVS
jgi:hypothetical protein